MSDEHLGDDVHDLLDNRLTPQRAAEAMAHLEACDECRTRWDELRAAREALRTSGAGIDMSFAQQLLDRDRMAQIASGETKHQARAARPRDRRPMTVAAVAAAVLVAVMGTSYMLGAPDEVGLEFAEDGPDTEAAVMQMGSEGMRAGDELRSWVHPDWESTGLIPIEAKVMRSRAGGNVLVASMLANADTVVVTEQHGLLSPQVREYFQSVDLGHTHAYLVSEHPQRLVWQCGDVVISATCDCALRTLTAVAATFPFESDPDAVDRVVDGFGELVDLVTPDA